MKLPIKDFISKCDQIYRKLRIWSNLRKKSLMENFIFCGVKYFNQVTGSSVEINSASSEQNLYSLSQNQHLRL